MKKPKKWNIKILTNSFKYFFKKLKTDLHKICIIQPNLCPQKIPRNWQKNFILINRWEAVPVFVEGLRLEIRAQRRTDSSLPQTHGRPAVPVPSVRTGLLAVRSPGPAHETSHYRLKKLKWPIFKIIWPNIFRIQRHLSALLVIKMLQISRRFLVRIFVLCKLDADFLAFCISALPLFHVLIKWMTKKINSKKWKISLPKNLWI